MNLLPYRNIVFSSGLNAAEVSAKFREHVKPRTAVSSTRSTKEYEGETGGDNFNIQRIISYRSSFLPVISGSFIQKPSGTKINMKMKLPVFTLIGVCLLAGFAAVIFIVLTIATYLFSRLNVVVLAPLGFLIIVWLITIVPFNMECNRSIKDFEKILEAKIES